MPYYCTVPRCTSMAGKAKNVSFHQFPRDEELAKLWNDILKRGKPYTKYSKVCSLHFKPEDYTITSVGKNKGQWRTLRKDAIPSQNLPSESPAPHARRDRHAWAPASPPTGFIDPRMQQQMAQAIYVQTMLAMHAAGATDALAVHPVNGLPIRKKDTDLPPTIEQLLRNQNTTQTEITSYKCAECLKCFKDPDVYMLHKRTHNKEDSSGSEKENNEENMLKANPILANLLKTTEGTTNSFDSNILSIENHIMAALAVNMESYIRNLSSMIRGDNVGDSTDDDLGVNEGSGGLNEETETNEGNRGLNEVERSVNEGNRVLNGDGRLHEVDLSINVSHTSMNGNGRDTNEDRRFINDVHGVNEEDRRFINEVNGTNEGDRSLNEGKGLNESTDSNRLVIDEDA